jgi:hypothetical protein
MPSQEEDQPMQKTIRVLLGSDELVAKRPFTHPDYVVKDRVVLSHMAKQVCMVLETHLDALQAGQPIVINEPDGRPHRFYVPRPMELSQAKRIFLVGFFGQKRKGMSMDYFENLDDRLIEQISSFQGILSYSTMTLPDGDCSNLVLLTEEEMKTKWAEGEIHQKATALSPGYYKSVRINNGIFPNGILRHDSLQITRVKYYDYQDAPPWRAIRKLI